MQVNARQQGSANILTKFLEQFTSSFNQLAEMGEFIGIALWNANRLQGHKEEIILEGNFYRYH